MDKTFSPKKEQWPSLTILNYFSCYLSYNSHFSRCSTTIYAYLCAPSPTRSLQGANNAVDKLARKFLVIFHILKYDYLVLIVRVCFEWAIVELNWIRVIKSAKAGSSRKSETNKSRLLILTERAKGSNLLAFNKLAYDAILEKMLAPMKQTNRHRKMRKSHTVQSLCWRYATGLR